VRQILEQRFFPYVIKPGRYAGGELGQIVKDPAGRTSFLYAHPDKYELGQSHVGLQILYHIVNRDDRFLCERAFAVDTDAEAVLRKENLPLFSLESSRPAKEFDVIGFSLVNETVYTSVLSMIDLAGLALRSADRAETDPLIIAGGPAAYNPEPLAPFIDLFFIGDAEEGLPRMLGLLHEMKDAGRTEKLEALCRQTESVYIPALYNDRQEPTVDYAPKEIQACVIPDLKPDYYPDQPIVPLVETVHNHLGIEIMRGCPQGCRFCMAGPIYRPVRLRHHNDILRQAETWVRNSGYEEVSLMSLSTSDYPAIENLAATLARRLEPARVSVALPSIRPGSLTPGTLDAVRRVRRFGITIAPEAGTERLRMFLRKNFPDEAVYDTVRLIFEKGWSTLKLYFMIGLPSETQDDLDGIIEMCRHIHRIGRETPGKHTINVTLSPFVPKPHTPFQWDNALPESEMFRRLTYVKNRLRAGQINVKHNSTQQAMLVCILGRGGREMADVIETAYHKGCRFDGWTETFRFDDWLAALEEHSIDPLKAIESVPFSTPLPWRHIRKGPSAEHLQHERNRTSTQLQDYSPRPRTSSTDETAPTATTEFGRGKRRVAGRSAVTPVKSRVRLRWGKDAQYRFMSHLDNLRLIERAIRRAQLPVSYSQGFNPTMKLSFGPPLPLGFTSEAECVDITLETTLMPHMIESLRRSMPPGFDIYEARSVLSKSPALSSTLNRVRYRLPLDMWSEIDRLEKQVDAMLDKESLECERHTKSDTKQVDIRPAIYDVKLTDEHLELVLGLGEGGYARPTEVAGFLSDGLTRGVVALPFHRAAMFRVDDQGLEVDAMEL